MSQILKVKNVQNKIAVLDIKPIKKIKFKEDNDNQLILSNGKICSSECINCANPKCMYLNSLDIEGGYFNDMSYDRNKRLCPVGAIEKGSKSVQINSTKCIGCGLCVSRCPIGAIHLKNGVANISQPEESHLVFLDNNQKNIEIQNDFIKNVIGIDKAGVIQKIDKEVLNQVYYKIQHLSQYEQNLLARNILIVLGCQAALSRQGDVYTRMDGFYDNGEQYGAFEVETGLDMLDVSRALLDDIAILHSRYAISKNCNHPLAICLTLPNKRTDYWQVVKDIKEITGIQINTITFGALLSLLWNLKDIENFDDFYIDIDNYSIRVAVESILNKKITLPYGYLSIFEIGK